MFCIISIFIVFITFAEFPSNKKASIINLSKLFFIKKKFSNYSSTKHIEVINPQYFVWKLRQNKIFYG